MYGGYEYATIPYGDVEAVAVVFVLDRRAIEIIFTSRQKETPFVSEKRQNIFKAEEIGG